MARFTQRRWSILGLLVLFAFLTWMQYTLHQVVRSQGPPSYSVPPTEISLASHPNDSYSSDTYHQFHPSPSRIHLPRVLTHVPTLPQPCLSEYLTHGTLSHPSCLTSTSPAIDFIWTWINGSDPAWAAQKLKYSTWDQIGRAQGVPVRHFRDHGELRHSMRAVEGAFKGKTGRRRLIVGDWDGEEHGHMRIGQKPGWLKMGGGADGGEGMEVFWHSQIWNSFEEAPEEMSEQDRRHSQAVMLSKSLPTFDSFSIESNLFNLPSSSPLLIYLNDDFFLTAPHTPTDFHSLLLGPLIPFAFSTPSPKWPPPEVPWKPGRYQGVAPMPEGNIGYAKLQLVSCNHEWSSLGRSNYLIGERFGHRQRSMLLHIPKPLLQPLMLESAIIWGSEFQKSTKRRFREDGKILPGDYNPVWLAEALLVERAREAMLWTWAVVKMGEERGEKGWWGQEEYNSLRQLFQVDAEDQRLEDIARSIPFSLWEQIFGRSPSIATNITIFPLPRESPRRTLNPSHLQTLLHRMSLPAPLQNTPGWTSLDGPIPPMGATIRRCVVDFDECFGGWWKGLRKGKDKRMVAGEMFKRIAFEKRGCGDCILSALIHSSGPLGMSQILPSFSSAFTASDPSMNETGEQPHLPLTMSWKKVDFSLEGILGTGRWGKTVDVKDWAEKLIARYFWTGVADSSSMFAMMRSRKDLDTVIEKIQGYPPPSTAALNDDLTSFSLLDEEHREAEDIGMKFEEWLEVQWPYKGDWEV